ncbi:MAG TPA: ABC transporter permease [Solirubrobacterales bacterium]|jgi:ABC-type nitrate/sulfonate/bicarbonate transport system permease component
MNWRTVRRWVLPAALIGALIGAWQIAAANGAIAEALNLEPFLVPSPAEVGDALWNNRTLLWENTWVTLREILFGLLAGVVVGLALAVAMRFSRILRDAVFPLTVAVQSVPVVVIAPILVVWFGFGIWVKVIVVALAVFFPIVVNTLDGLRSVDPEAVKMMRTLDASGWAIFRRVEAPTAVPSFFSGAKVAVAIAPIVALFAELAGSNSGLMRLIIQDNANLEIARMFASVVILAVIGVLLVGLTALAQRLVVTWR